MLDDILSSTRGTIEAPAGCGKTHLLIEILKIRQEKPYLVLTHTTAGVSALRKRMKQHNVPSSNCFVTTIDGWFLKLVNNFKSSCRMISTLDNAGRYYTELREVVLRYLNTGCLIEIITATYSRLLVDEYQDCNLQQHLIVNRISDSVPTTVFGDPMQSIFNFGGPMPSWSDSVLSQFPLIGELDQPWRWINAGCEDFGHWILNCRNVLLSGGRVDLNYSPINVTSHRLTGNTQTDKQNQISAQYAIRHNNNDSLLVIGNPYRADSRHDFASLANGVEVVEPVDLKDIITLGATIDNYQMHSPLDSFLLQLSTMMTGLNRSNLLSRVESIINGRNRTEATPIEGSLVDFKNAPSKTTLIAVLKVIDSSSCIKVFRRFAYTALRDSVSLWDGTTSLKEATEKTRETRRHAGDGRVSHNAIGSTLLLKGLEADRGLILDASEMNPQNLYVAISRASKTLDIFSNSSVVG